MGKCNCIIFEQIPELPEQIMEFLVNMLLTSLINVIVAGSRTDPVLLTYTGQQSSDLGDFLIGTFLFIET